MYIMAVTSSSLQKMNFTTSTFILERHDRSFVILLSFQQYFSCIEPVGDNRMLCAIETYLQWEIILPPAGLEPGALE